MLHSIIAQFLGQVEWGQLDYLMIDLPPGTGDVAISLVQTVPLTGAVVVTTPSDVSLQDARKAIEMFKHMNVDFSASSKTSVTPLPALPKEIDIFSKGGGERTANSSTCRSWAASSSTRHPQRRRHRPSDRAGRRPVRARPASLFAFAKNVIERVDELNSTQGGNIIEVQ